MIKSQIILPLDITLESKKITLRVINGPNEDCPKFYEDISNIIAEFNNDGVMTGDEIQIGTILTICISIILGQRKWFLNK